MFHHTIFMGIPRLNQFLRSHGGSHIQEIALTDLRGKKVAIDASIYMYRFLGDRCLLAGIYQMGTLFQQWGIEPVFVFDGAPPKEKHEAQQERQQRKEEAYLAHKQLEHAVQTGARSVNSETNMELEQLRRKSLRLGKKRVGQVRELLAAMGVVCMDAPEEADAVCAGLVASGDCWACLSDDTDMFACGCSRVLRNLDLLGGTCVLYDWDGQRAALGITQDDFRLVCAAAGCDYGIGVPNVDIHDAWNLWMRWRVESLGLALPDYLVGGGATWRGGNPEDLRAAAGVFRQMGAAQYSAPSAGAPDTVKTKAFLQDHGFVFADE